MACEQAFIRTLRERGMRLTPQREMVLSAMHDLEGHATVDEIYRRVQVRSAAVDPSTVYRTLELLDGLGMLAILDAGDGQRRFALAGGHGGHVHLVCHSCGGDLAVGIDIFGALVDTLACQHGFVLDLTRLSLPGVCAACAGH
jgi:Fur family transcriptional regulator, ferric uptake regulator